MSTDAEILKRELLKMFARMYPSDYRISVLSFPQEEKDDLLKDDPVYITKAKMLETLESEIVKTYVRNIWGSFSCGIFRFVEVDNSGPHNIDYEIIQLSPVDLVMVENFFLNEINRFEILIPLFADLRKLSANMHLVFREVSPAIYLFYGHGLITSISKSIKQNRNLLLESSTSDMDAVLNSMKKLHKALKYSLMNIYDECTLPPEQSQLNQLRENRSEIFVDSIFKNLDSLQIKSQLISLFDKESSDIAHIEEILQGARSIDMLDPQDKNLREALSEYLKMDGPIHVGKYFQREEFLYRSKKFVAQDIAKSFECAIKKSKSEAKKLKLYTYANFYEKEMRVYAQELFPDRKSSYDFLNRVTEQAQSNFTLTKIIPDLINELNQLPLTVSL